jgi:lipoprotein NlpI
LLCRGCAWNEKQEYDKAINDFNEAIRLDPKNPVAYQKRGYAWNEKKEYDKAIADYSEAICRQNPNEVWGSQLRAYMWYLQKDYEKAIADCDEAIRMEPENALAYFHRGLACWLSLRDGEAVTGMKDFLDHFGWRGIMPTYAATLGYLAARRSGKPDEARKFLDDFRVKGDMTSWPAPLIGYLAGDIDKKTLLASSPDDNQTETNACLGFELLLKGKTDEAKDRLLWVKEHGNIRALMYTLSLAELDRLETAKPPGPKP